LNAPLISEPDYNHDYILYISALVVSVARFLVQIGDDNHEHVIYYNSKNLSGPPLKYNHEEKLSLAVFLAVQKLRHYILLRMIKVIANSNPMQYMLNHWQINLRRFLLFSFFKLWFHDLSFHYIEHFILGKDEINPYLP
jgi:hypothetical protein